MKRRFSWFVCAALAAGCDCGGAIPTVTDGGAPGDSAIASDASFDAGASDAGADAGRELPVPRLLAPISTERVATLRPLLRATPIEGFAIEIEICAERACAAPIESGALAADGTYRVSSTLAPGVKFWRARASAGEFGEIGDWSAVWNFRVPHGSPHVDSGSGLVLDVNGDGFADLLDTEYPSTMARTRIEYGRPDPTVPPREVPWEIWRPTGHSRPAVALGDVNGDGFVDVALSRHPGHDEIVHDVFFGAIDGLSDEPAQILEVTEEAFAVARANGTDIVAFAGPAWGAAIHPIGDVDRDGYADIAVEFEGAGSDPWAFIHRGTPDGIAPTPTTAFGPLTWGPETTAFNYACTLDADGDGAVELAFAPDFNGVVLWFEFGPAIVRSTLALAEPTDGGMANAGRTLGCGDFDGDGYGDIAVAVEYFYDLGRGHRIYTAYGSPTGLGSLEPLALAREESRTALLTVCSVGDADSDGFDDLLVSVESIPDYDTHAFVFFGAADGFGASPRSVTLDAPTTVGILIDNVSHGDMNGDSHEDFVFSVLAASWDPVRRDPPYIGFWLSSHDLAEPARRATSFNIRRVYMGQ
jgi:hypothetical protein